MSELQQQDRAGSADGEQEAVRIGLVATPPDHPAEITERLAEELAHELGPQSRTLTVWGQ
jgi:hypothetical protein